MTEIRNIVGRLRDLYIIYDLNETMAGIEFTQIVSDLESVTDKAEADTKRLNKLNKIYTKWFGESVNGITFEVSSDVLSDNIRDLIDKANE